MFRKVFPANGPIAAILSLVVLADCLGVVDGGRLVARERMGSPGPTHPVDCLLVWDPWSMCRRKELQSGMARREHSR
jgi:hypothetical protein